MHGHVPVALLETAVLADVMQVVTSDDDRTLHLQLLDDAGEDASADAHVAGERALLVDVGAIDRLWWSREVH